MKAPLVVCALADEAPLVARGSTADHFCYRCHKRVLTAQSTLEKLAEHPDWLICCMRCVLALPFPEGLDLTTAAKGQDLRREIADTVPNTWRWRH